MDVAEEPLHQERVLVKDTIDLIDDYLKDNSELDKALNNNDEAA